MHYNIYNYTDSNIMYIIDIKNIYIYTYIYTITCIYIYIYMYVLE